MAKLDAVLFDLDGTLADTLQDIAEAMNRALDARGLPTHPATAYRALIGQGARELARKALPKGEEACTDALLAAFRADYFARPIVHTAPYPGISALLAELQARGLRLAVLSNKPQAPTAQIVAALFPGVPFAAVYGERAGIPKKPAPQGALALAAELDVAPGRCAFVGDSEVDLETARAAGMLPVAVRWGFRDEAELRAAGAEHLLAEPQALLKLL